MERKGKQTGGTRTIAPPEKNWNPNGWADYTPSEFELRKVKASPDLQLLRMFQLIEEWYVKFGSETLITSEEREYLCKHQSFVSWFFAEMYRCLIDATRLSDPKYLHWKMNIMVPLFKLRHIRLQHCATATKFEEKYQLGEISKEKYDQERAEMLRHLDPDLWLQLEELEKEWQDGFISRKEQYERDREVFLSRGIPSDPKWFTFEQWENFLNLNFPQTYRMMQQRGGPEKPQKGFQDEDELNEWTLRKRLYEALIQIQKRFVLPPLRPDVALQVDEEEQEQMYIEEFEEARPVPPPPVVQRKLGKPPALNKRK